MLAAVASSSPKDQATPVRTTTTHFPNIPDTDKTHLLTIQDSKAQSKTRQTNYSATDTNSQKSNSQMPKSYRTTSTSALSLAEPLSTTASKPTQLSRSRGTSRRISLDSSAGPVLGRQISEAVTLSTPLSGSQSAASSRRQATNTRRIATKSVTVVDDINSISKAFSQDAESSPVENSFTQNNDGHRRGKERGPGSSRTDLITSTKYTNQNQIGAIMPAHRIRPVPESTTTPSSELHETPISQSSTVSSRTPQSRQPVTAAPHSTSETVTSRSISQTAGIQTVSSPSTQTSTTSQQNETQNEPNPTPSPSALRSSYRSSLVEADDVQSGLSRNSVVQQSDVSTNNRARSRGSDHRKPTSCADAVDTNSNTGCSKNPQIRYNFCNTSITQNNFIMIQK